MSFVRGSLLTVLPLLIVWLVANLFMTARVETDLAARAAAAVGSIIDKPSVIVARYRRGRGSEPPYRI